MQGERIACAAVSLHLYVHCLAYKLSGPRHSTAAFRLRRFSNGVYHVMTIIVAESHPDMGLDTTIICLSPDVLARDF